MSPHCQAGLYQAAFPVLKHSDYNYSDNYYLNIDYSDTHYWNCTHSVNNRLSRYSDYNCSDIHHDLNLTDMNCCRLTNIPCFDLNTDCFPALNLFFRCFSAGHEHCLFFPDIDTRTDSRLPFWLCMYFYGLHYNNHYFLHMNPDSAVFFLPLVFPHHFPHHFFEHSLLRLPLLPYFPQQHIRLFLLCSLLSPQTAFPEYSKVIPEVPSFYM